MDIAHRRFPKYGCHKQVRALKIKSVMAHAHADPSVSVEEFAKTPDFQGAHLFPDEAGYPPIPVDADWFRKHNPEAGGYYIVYEDGCTSYSPKKAFESRYTLQKEEQASENPTCGESMADHIESLIFAMTNYGSRGIAKRELARNIDEAFSTIRVHT